ncbi:MAG: A/G-specific adenine glycosylase [Phycisphaerales bacterium]|nr:A/G-specific adenine glycosylase [Phycisphaerales bacterium]
MAMTRESVDLTALTTRIERWFQSNARDLPWRRRRTRWRAYVSEIMLQQTQVSRVVERFEGFMARFPKPRDLAEAPEDDVNALWAGLGYYRRARLLQAAARVMVEKHGGRVPGNMDDLLALPGVGRYTAGAIASIACDQPAPIVDGNVHRVLARIWCDPVAADDREGSERTWQRSQLLVESSSQPAVFNEGLMELGAMVCTPRSPDCRQCPVNRSCAARRQDLVDVIPPPKQRPVQQVEHHHAVGIIRRGRLVVHQRSDRGRWAGLWQVPTVEAARRLRPADICRRVDLPIEQLTHVGAFERVLTHRRVQFHVYRGELARGARLPAAFTWIGRDVDLPVGVAQRKTLEMLHWLDG